MHLAFGGIAWQEASKSPRSSNVIEALKLVQIQLQGQADGHDGISVIQKLKNLSLGADVLGPLV